MDADQLAFIYALEDPRDNKIKYIGACLNLSQRLISHLGPQRANPDKQQWLNSLKQDKVKPKLVILEETSCGEMKEREKFWIGHYSKTEPLLNVAHNRKVVFERSRKPGVVIGKFPYNFRIAFQVKKKWSGLGYREVPGTARKLEVPHKHFAYAVSTIQEAIDSAIKRLEQMIWE